MLRIPRLPHIAGRAVDFVRYAETHRGDFSLKTADDYVVPEAQRVNAQKKRRQLVLLEESVHAIKAAFNERFMDLRDTKKSMLETLSKEHARLNEIETKLGLPLTSAPPAELTKEEEPERRYVASDADVRAYEEKKSASKSGGGFGGFGGGGGAGTNPEAAPAAAAAPVVETEGSALLQARK
eukprot:118398-Pleurochrysis_carterae.AAC.1